MTREQIIEALEKGETVRHLYFDKDECIRQDLNTGDYIDEKGYVLDRADFWKYRQEKYFDTGWEIVKKEQKKKIAYYKDFGAFVISPAMTKYITDRGGDPIGMSDYENRTHPLLIECIEYFQENHIDDRTYDSYVVEECESDVYSITEYDGKECVHWYYDVYVVK
jgi:hypothetical protein